MKKIVFILILCISPNAFAADILIFGGTNHEDFLGCLTCNPYSNDSVFNKFSRYGWENDFGIWNPFGQYRNQYSRVSACNEYTSNSPVLVDRLGTYYGRLTINQYSIESICGIRGNAQICKILMIMCSRR